MPRVTLYVREADQEVWERAKALAGGEESLSAVVSEALRQYVERWERQEKAREKLQQQMEPIELKVNAWRGNEPDHRRTYRVRFTGTLVGTTDPDGWRSGDWTEVYLTEGGNLVVYGSWKDFLFYKKCEDFDELIESYGQRLGEDVLAEIAEAMGEDYAVEIE